MRADPSSQNMVTVDKQMVRRQRCRDIITSTSDIVDTVSRRHMLHDHAKLRQALA